MRKIVALTFITLDGVMQAPGGPEEDMSGNFEFGGWTVPFFDEASGQVMAEQIDRPFDLLLGRKTYDIFAGYWPLPENKETPFGEKFDKATKYVATHRPVGAEWSNTVSLSNVDEIRKVRDGNGPDLQVYGSSDLLQSLLKHDLVDELWLKTFPIVLGKGKRLFGEGTTAAAFELTKSTITPSGVIVANYRRAGDVKTGSF
jgi:dihydrofolate reductase